jgi:dihydropteroate synthase
VPPPPGPTKGATPTLTCGDRVLALGARTYVMGIVNVTPDSFSDGGRFVDVDVAVGHALRLLDEGADVLDIGGESTRPGAAAVSVDDERRRVLPVIEGLVRRGVTNLSIDTRHAVVAKDALAAGARWVNDVEALAGPGMIAACLPAEAVVLMHWKKAAAFDARGDHVVYADVVDDVAAFLAARAAAAVAGGIAVDRVVVDAGLGFGKSVADNVRLLCASRRLRALGPVLVGASRKRFVGALAGVDVVVDRDAASVGAACAAALHGADLVRVHAVRDTVQALRVVAACR